MNVQYKELNKKEKIFRLKEIGRSFLKLGFLAFGGPAAHIAMMEDEYVAKRKWLSQEELVDLMSITHLIPGPNSTELALFIGLKHGGYLGLLLAGLAFILPAMAITILLAYIYVRYGSLPELKGIMLGIKPAVIVIILSALFRMSKLIVTNKEKIILAILIGIVYFLGISEFMLLLSSGIIFSLYLKRKDLPNKPLVIEPVSLSLIFYIFFKIGAILYGSGYVLLAFLERELVFKRNLLTMSQLIDSIAIGEFTPGPVLTTSSFIGYIMHGVFGSIVATFGIFLPSFLVVLVINKFVGKLRKSEIVAGFLDGVNVASIVLMAFVTVKLGINSLVSPTTIIIFIIVFILKNKYKLNSGFLVITSGAVGYVLSLL
ncbi:MAG: chromate transporter [Erysipelothrix sp.]|nr:chromate transporter [Erysipelothrix sp.]